MKLFHLKYAVPFLLFTFFTQCSNDNQPRSAEDCTNVICTQNFITLFITVEDKSGVKIPLDSFEVTETTTAKVLTPEYTAQEFQIFRQQGSYPLYDDSYMAEHQNKERLLTFKGFIDAMTVVSGNYVVAADCCHVSLISGDEVLLIGPDN